jgi:ATP-dependent helicase HepA
MNFTVGCLVISDKNSEYGPCRVLEYSLRGNVKIKPLWYSEPISGTINSFGLIKYPIYIGQRLKISFDNNDFVEGYVQKELPETNGLRHYFIRLTNNDEITVNESLLLINPPDPLSPLDILKSLNWKSPPRFYSRWKFNEVITFLNKNSENIPAIIGSRIKPFAHQIYAVRRILSDRELRFILADEVGLGKTIEAGMVIQSLLSINPKLRILIIAPGSMSRQWLCEIYLRFGSRVFTHIDTERLRKLNHSANLSELLENKHLIISTTALMQSNSLKEIVLKKEWDIIIVDEVHHFSSKHILYPFLEKLSKNTKGFLALSATPSKRESRGLNDLFSLVFPNTYDRKDINVLEEKLNSKYEIWENLSRSIQLSQEAALEGEEITPEIFEWLTENWENIIKDDAVFSNFIERMKNREQRALDELIAYVQEYYRIDHRIIRTRRATLKFLNNSFSERNYEILKYEPDSLEYSLEKHFEKLTKIKINHENQYLLKGILLRALNTTPYFLKAILDLRLNSIKVFNKEEFESIYKIMLSDPGASEEESFITKIIKRTPIFQGEDKWLSTAIGLAQEWKENTTGGCSRMIKAAGWIINHLKENPENKILVFSQERIVVQEFCAFLKNFYKQSPSIIEVFHHEISDDKLNEVSLRFQRDPNCRILISNELGGEGRNFQIASAIVHLDQPWSVAKVEQRIGRLDRVSRDPSKPILSVILNGPSEIENIFIDLYKETFNVYESSIGGLEFELPAIQNEIYNTLYMGDFSALKSYCDDLNQKIKSYFKQADQDFQYSLDSSKQEIEKAQEMVEILEQLETPEYTYDAVSFYAKSLSLRCKKVDEKTMNFEVSSEVATEFLPDLNLGSGIYNFEGTFDRNLAFQKENLQYFSLGHRLIDALRKSIINSSNGRVTILARDLGLESRGHIYMVLLARCYTDFYEMGNELSVGLIMKANRRLIPEFICLSLELHLDEEIKVSEIRSTDLKLKLESLNYSEREKYMKIKPEVIINQLKVNFKDLCDSVEDGIKFGISLIRNNRKPLVEKALNELQEDLRYELGYYRAQLENQAPEISENAERQLELRNSLLKAVRNENIEADAIAIIIGAERDYVQTK